MSFASRFSAPAAVSLATIFSAPSHAATINYEEGFNGNATGISVEMLLGREELVTDNVSTISGVSGSGDNFFAIRAGGGLRPLLSITAESGLPITSLDFAFDTSVALTAPSTTYFLRALDSAGAVIDSLTALLTGDNASGWQNASFTFAPNDDVKSFQIGGIAGYAPNNRWFAVDNVRIAAYEAPVAAIPTTGAMLNLVGGLGLLAGAAYGTAAMSRTTRKDNVGFEPKGL